MPRPRPSLGAAVRSGSMFRQSSEGEVGPSREANQALSRAGAGTWLDCPDRERIGRDRRAAGGAARVPGAEPRCALGGRGRARAGRAGLGTAPSGRTAIFRPPFLPRPPPRARSRRRGARRGAGRATDRGGPCARGRMGPGSVGHRRDESHDRCLIAIGADRMAGGGAAEAARASAPVDRAVSRRTGRGPGSRQALRARAKPRLGKFRRARVGLCSGRSRIEGVLGESRTRWRNVRPATPRSASDRDDLEAGHRSPGGRNQRDEASRSRDFYDENMGETHRKRPSDASATARGRP